MTRGDCVGEFRGSNAGGWLRPVQGDRQPRGGMVAGSVCWPERLRAHDSRPWDQWARAASANGRPPPGTGIDSALPSESDLHPRLEPPQTRIEQVPDTVTQQAEA